MQDVSKLRKVAIDKNGSPRFIESPVIRWMLDKLREKGVTLNDFPWWEFVNHDIGQFYQLIGYSVSGYCELHMVDQASQDEAVEEAKKLGFPWQQGVEAVREWKKVHGFKVD